MGYYLVFHGINADSPGNGLDPHNVREPYARCRHAPGSVERIIRIDPARGSPPDRDAQARSLRLLPARASMGSTTEGACRRCPSRTATQGCGTQEEAPKLRCGMSWRLFLAWGSQSSMMDNAKAVPSPSSCEPLHSQPFFSLFMTRTPVRGHRPRTLAADSGRFARQHRMSRSIWITNRGGAPFASASRRTPADALAARARSGQATLRTPSENASHPERVAAARLPECQPGGSR